MNSVRVMIQVDAGLLPGQPMEEHQRKFVLTSEEWNELPGEKQGEALAHLNGKATGYTNWLMLQPDRLNWVRLEWVWM